ncbi:MAG: hypothetical protein B6244_03330 [Candidatus Cloacimonetes bacterium 4572_55]|nr:MAG: hypothetical protein B6244_03330 [Candidatus Cloacimonetes bacterium 4572_55]
MNKFAYQKQLLRQKIDTNRSLVKSELETLKANANPANLFYTVIKKKVPSVQNQMERKKAQMKGLIKYGMILSISMAMVTAYYLRRRKRAVMAKKIDELNEV